MSDPGEWFQAMPIFTKVLFSGTLGITLAGNLGLINPYYLIFQPVLIWHKFEIWRLVTCIFFAGKLSFPFLIHLYFLYSYSRRVEEGMMDRRPGDMLWMLIVVWAALLVIAYFFQFPIIGPSISMSILYVWSLAHKDQIVSFYFGTQFPAMYLPWALMAFNVLIGGGYIMELAGIVAGHIYFYFKFLHARDFGGSSFLETPSFVKYYFPDEGPGRGGFGVAPPSRRPNNANDDPRPNAWGQGHHLGGN
eukprot:m.334918 g.334918  ORF g.334918 m.334918 type:complete len:248 (+) comp17465_c0_seq1:119-862(+)